MERIKILNIDNLSNETLKSIVDFNFFRCDKIIINCNSKITQEQIDNKVLELNKINYDLIELTHTFDYNTGFLPYDKLKYGSEWFDIELDINNEIESIGKENIELLSKILLLLTSVGEIEELCDYICEDFYKEIAWLSTMTVEGEKFDVNPNCEIEVNMY